MPRYFYGATHLVGGDEGALDAIDGTNLQDEDAAICIGYDGVYFYRLEDGSGASESAPETIAPDTNAGTKRWIRVHTLENQNTTTTTEA